MNITFEPRDEPRDSGEIIIRKNTVLYFQA